MSSVGFLTFDGLWREISARVSRFVRSASGRTAEKRRNLARSKMRGFLRASGAAYMLAINLAKLALIELEYSAADCSRRKATTSDSLERGALNIQLPKIMAAKT